MTLIEEQMDLFLVPQSHYLAHCISGDFALGAGIATRFDRTYNMRKKLNLFYPNRDRNDIGKALLVDNVFNLVTKSRCFQNPGYDDLYVALIDMREQMEEKHITKLAMPRIGCGLDRLDWLEVRRMIEEVFAETDVSIIICTL